MADPGIGGPWEWRTQIVYFQVYFDLLISVVRANDAVTTKNSTSDRKLYVTLNSGEIRCGINVQRLLIPFDDVI